MRRRLATVSAFTLVELLVVILVLGVLLAITLPNLLHAQDAAKDAEVKTKLNTAYKALKVDAVRRESSFPDTGAEVVSVVKASEAEPFPIADTTTPAAGALGVCSAAPAQAVLVALSRSGTSFLLTAGRDSGSLEVVHGTCADLAGEVGTPENPISLANVGSIDAGSFHTCAVIIGGRARCWGSNGSGQLGNSATGANAAHPVSVSGITTATQVSAGHDHTCALLSNQSVTCWGANDYGQLGVGMESSSTPVAVEGLSGVRSVSAGTYATCAALTSGAVKCWGSNAFDQLSNGSTDAYGRVTVPGVTAAKAVSVGTYNTCALLTGGGIQCWGSNAYGQLGDGENDHQHTCASQDCSAVPVPVYGVSTAAEVSVGYNGTCARLSDGSVVCWGNGASASGFAYYTASNRPVAISAISGATSVSASRFYATCAALSNGTVKCWGLNANGEQGNGSRYGDNLTPAAVNSLAGATTVEMGEYHACAVLSDKTARCWGWNAYGQLGSGSEAPWWSGVPETVMDTGL